MGANSKQVEEFTAAATDDDAVPEEFEQQERGGRDDDDETNHEQHHQRGSDEEVEERSFLLNQQHGDDDEEADEHEEAAAPATAVAVVGTTSRSRAAAPSVLLNTHRMPRQWLKDRVLGQSRPWPRRIRNDDDGDDENEDDEAPKPPSRICYVPPFVLWCPDILEQNCLCETVGRSGCYCCCCCCELKTIEIRHPNMRRRVLRVALFTNVVGLFLMVLACFGIADHNFDVLWNFSYTEVIMRVHEGPTDFNKPATYKVGLRAIAWKSYHLDEQGILPFSDFCMALKDEDNSVTDTMLAILKGTNTDGEEVVQGCDACEKTSRRVVPSLFLSMLSYIPNFTTDVLRQYANYDVNCQKFLATTFSWVSLSTAIYTWVNYRDNCFTKFNTDPIAFDEDFNPIPDYVHNETATSDSETTAPYAVLEYDWEAGLAQVCLAAAALLKVIDIICNFILPTPTITRDFVEQAEYERSYGDAAAAVANGGADGCDVTTTSPVGSPATIDSEQISR